MAAFNDRALLRTKDATGNGDGGAAVKPTNSLGSPNRRRLWGSKASVGLWPSAGSRLQGKLTLGLALKLTAAYSTYR